MFENNESKSCKVLKLTVKSVCSKLYKFELEDDKRVSELKRFLHQDQGLSLVPEKQQLIYNGRVLMDDDALSSYDIDERKFMVVMKKPFTRTDKVKQEHKDFVQECAEDKYWSNLKKRQSAMYSKHMQNQTDYQQALRDIHAKPEHIGRILARIALLNKELATDLRNNLDDFLLLLGLNKAKVERNLVEEFLTAQDKQAVQRLMALGFTYLDAVQAFIEADRRENKAADLLLKTKVEENSQNDSI